MLGETVSLDHVQFLATTSDIAAMGLELDHLLLARAGSDLEDLPVVIDHSEDAVVQLNRDDPVGVHDTDLDPLGRNRDRPPTRNPTPHPRRLGGRWRRRSRDPGTPQPREIVWLDR
jgi:hypothetical protein